MTKKNIINLQQYKAEKEKTFNTLFALYDANTAYETIMFAQQNKEDLQENLKNLEKII